MREGKKSDVAPASFSSLGRKIGLLGGTFDPVHNGHLAIATAVHQRLGLDSMLFIPAAQPPHKVPYAVTPFAQRCQMLKLALAEHRDFFYTTMEEQRQGPSFTIDTLTALRTHLPGGEFYFVIGSDAFVAMGTWKRFLDIPSYCHLVVLPRGDTGGADLAPVVPRIFPAFTFHESLGCWHSLRQAGTIRFLDLPRVAISSTMIRERLDAGLAIEAMVPSAVARYLSGNGVYPRENGSG